MKKTLLLIAAVLTFPSAAAYGQSWDPTRPFMRSNEKFKAAFKTVVADARKSTVRVRCDGRDTAMGMVVGPGGWVLTKYHDLKGFVTCKLPGGSEVDAELVGVHPRYDVALLKIDASDLTPITLADSKKTKVGDWIATVGIDELPITFGVVGVATRKLRDNGGPIEVKKNFGFLGVRVVAGDGGLRIEMVEPRNPASKAGLRRNDILLSIAGKKLSQPQELVNNLMNYKPGDKVTFSVKRGDKEFKVTPTLTDRPMSRGEKQNRMGSALSERRTGFPVVLQHDAVVRPNDCGGPLVDLDGRVVAMNISRVGRTETHAIPAELIQPILFDLMAGKLAPPEKSKIKAKTIALKSQLQKAKEQLAALEKLVDQLRKQLKQADVDASAKPKKNETPQPQSKSDIRRPSATPKVDPSRLNPFPPPQTPPTSWMRHPFLMVG